MSLGIFIFEFWTPSQTCISSHVSPVSIRCLTGMDRTTGLLFPFVLIKKFCLLDVPCLYRQGVPFISKQRTIKLTNIIILYYNDIIIWKKLYWDKTHTHTHTENKIVFWVRTTEFYCLWIIKRDKVPNWPSKKTRRDQTDPDLPDPTRVTLKTFITWDTDVRDSRRSSD